MADGYKTDGAAPDQVIAEIALCAASWVPEARIIGNVRAGDILRACQHVLKEMHETETINWRDDPDAIVEDDEPMVGRDYA